MQTRYIHMHLQMNELYSVSPQWHNLFRGSTRGEDDSDLLQFEAFRMQILLISLCE